jgi:hypothetical protein
MNNFPKAHALFIVDAPRSYDDLSKRQQEFVHMMHDAGFTGDTIRRPELKAVYTAANQGASFPWPSWLTGDKTRRANRGVFYIPELAEYASNHAPEEEDSGAARRPEDDPQVDVEAQAYAEIS